MADLVRKPITRALIVVVGLVIFLGLIAGSLLFAVYPVKGVVKNELFITKQSLTHAITRTKDGKLTVVEGAGKACPT